MSVAEIERLTVRYGNFTALNELSVRVPEGCVGLLGPNGAGKTTFIKTLLGFVQPAGGTAKVLGHDITTESRLARQKIGMMPEQDCHIPGLSAVGFVAYAGELSGMPSDQALRRAHEVLEYCGLGEARYRNVETYSTGMKQRIKFAQALVHGPKLLLLDEPTNGLDPRGREEMLELIRSVSHGKGLNVIISSHLLPDIERTCDEVMVIFAGQLRAQGTIKQLKAIAGHPVDVELREPSEAFLEEAKKGGAEVIEVRRRSYRMKAPGLPEEVARLMFSAAARSGAQIRGLAPAERSLEEVFLSAVAAGSKPEFSV
jgi:ABC-2 type transport system ATP-binding protein